MPIAIGIYLRINLPNITYGISVLSKLMQKFSWCTRMVHYRFLHTLSVAQENLYLALRPILILDISRTKEDGNHLQGTAGNLVTKHSYKQKK